MTKWTNKDMLRFARIASEGAYGDYKGCETLIKKLARYKILKKKKRMSRYTKELDNGKEVAYGWDHATGYFLQVFDVPDDDGEDNLLIDECSMFTKMSNGKMIELMNVYELPESHLELVAMDLPI